MKIDSNVSSSIPAMSAASSGRPQPLLQRPWGVKCPLHLELLIEQHADHQRQRIGCQQTVGIIVVRPVERVGHEISLLCATVAGSGGSPRSIQKARCRRYAQPMNRRVVLSRAGQLLRTLGILIIGALFFFSIIVWFNIQRSFPQVDGQLRMQGLDGEIEIIRDIDGVPHIYADTAHDLMFAQGFVEAQDRYWQMDFFRHVGNGELSEMFGQSQLETDLFLRTLGWGEIAEAEARKLPADIAGYLDAYAEGVNRFSGDRRGGELSFEHFVLRLISRSYSPDAWKPSDTLAFTKVMAWDLSGNLDEEIERSILAGVMAADRVEELFPEYSTGFPIIAPSSEQATAPTIDRLDLDLVTPDLRDLRASLRTLHALVGTRGPEIGSNNWAVSGDLTSTGMPMLANDPHLGIAMPSIWYEVGLHCREVSMACPFDVVGFSFPGAPGVVIGHNADIAWGVTNLNPDEMDLYVEKINPANPNQYEYMGQWIDMDIRTETIVVAGAESERLIIRSTIHGPIISDTYEPLEDFEASSLAVSSLAPPTGVPEQYAVSMSWTALDESTIAEAILGINVASDWNEFREAAAKWDIAAQNLVYADTSGNVGYQSTGRIPIRTQGDGRCPGGLAHMNGLDRSRSTTCRRSSTRLVAMSHRPTSHWSTTRTLTSSTPMWRTDIGPIASRHSSSPQTYRSTPRTCE